MGCRGGTEGGGTGRRQMTCLSAQPLSWRQARLHVVEAAGLICRVWSAALVLYAGCWGFLRDLGMGMAASSSLNPAELLPPHFQSAFLLRAVTPPGNAIALRTPARKLFPKTGGAAAIKELLLSAPSQGAAGHR